MGQYLYVGIANELFVPRKKRGWTIYCTKEEIEKKLSGKINLDLYDFIEEDEEGYLWKLNKEVFLKNIEAFLKEQLKNTEQEMPEELVELLQTGNYEAIMLAAKNKQYCELQQLDLNHGYLLKDVDVYTETLVFFTEGKAYLECYWSLFEYMSKLIHKASENVLKDTVVIALS